MTIEDQFTALEASVKNEFAALDAKLAGALADEQHWCERYWDYVALAAFIVGILVKWAF